MPEFSSSNPSVNGYFLPRLSKFYEAVAAIAALKEYRL